MDDSPFGRLKFSRGNLYPEGRRKKKTDFLEGLVLMRVPTIGRPNLLESYFVYLWRGLLDVTVSAAVAGRYDELASLLAFSGGVIVGAAGGDARPARLSASIMDGGADDDDCGDVGCARPRKEEMVEPLERFVSALFDGIVSTLPKGIRRDFDLNRKCRVFGTVFKCK